MSPVLPAFAVLLIAAAPLASQTPPAPPARSALSVGSVPPGVRAAFTTAQRSAVRLKATVAPLQSVLALDSRPDLDESIRALKNELAEKERALQSDIAAIEEQVKRTKEAIQVLKEVQRKLEAVQTAMNEVLPKLLAVIGGGSEPRLQVDLAKAIQDDLAKVSIALDPDGLDRLGAGLAAGGGDLRSECQAAIRSAYQRLRASISSTYERLLREASGKAERVQLERQRDGILEQLKRAELAKLRDCERGA